MLKKSLFFKTVFQAILIFCVSAIVTHTAISIYKMETEDNVPPYLYSFMSKVREGVDFDFNVRYATTNTGQLVLTLNIKDKNISNTTILSKNTFYPITESDRFYNIIC
jgi:hypothetical protein